MMILFQFFKGKRTYFVLLLPLAYFLYFTFCTPPVLFNSDHTAWFFTPFTTNHKIEEVFNQLVRLFENRLNYKGWMYRDRQCRVDVKVVARCVVTRSEVLRCSKYNLLFIFYIWASMFLLDCTYQGLCSATIQANGHSIHVEIGLKAWGQLRILEQTQWHLFGWGALAAGPEYEATSLELERLYPEPSSRGRKQHASAISHLEKATARHTRKNKRTMAYKWLYLRM